MSTPVLHHGDQDFDLQELKRFRVERVPSIASLSGEAASSQARLVFAIDEEALYIGQQGVWRPASGSSVSWQSPVASEVNLPVLPVPGNGESRVVIAGPYGAPSVYAFDGSNWVNILSDSRLVYKDASRAFTALPTVTGAPHATLPAQLITKDHYETQTPTWFTSYSGGVTWAGPVATPAALGTATVLGTVKAVLAGTPSTYTELYIWSPGNVWRPLTDQSVLASAIASKVAQTTQVIAGTGLSGGGALSGNVTLDVSYGTTTGTAAQGDDARLSRSISVGTGMTGGGSLGSGNVSVGLSFGTAAGTVCAGDDPRFVTLASASQRADYAFLLSPAVAPTGTLALVPDSVNQLYRNTGADYNTAPVSSNTSRTWKAVASSYDGKILLALDSASSTVQLSLNGGATWANKHTAQIWSDCTMSYDGSLMIVVGASQNIYTSTDGTVWTSRDSSRAWSKVRVSANGKIAVAAVDGGAVYLSTDNGATWAAQTPTATTWGGLAISGDGTYIVAVADGGHLFLSSNTGGTWTDDPAAFGPLGNKAFKGCAISENGSTILVVAGSADNFASTIDRVTGTVTTTAPSTAYSACAMSYDGRVQIAVASSLYVSVTSGGTWGAKGSATPTYSCVATSFDGTRCLLGGNGPGTLYTGIWGWELVSGLKTSTMYLGTAAAVVGGAINGTIAATQVAVGSGTDTIGGSSAFTWDSTKGSLRITQPVLSATLPTAMLTLTGAACTAVTAGSESIDLDIALDRTVQWATGALATQRAIVIRSPTYAFVGASVLGDADTLCVLGPPSGGTNATLTEACGIVVETRALTNVTTSFALKATAATGGTTNWAAGFVGPVSVSTGILRVVTTALASVQTPTANTAVHVAYGTGNGTITRLLLDTYMGTGAGYNSYSGRSARGSNTAPSAIQNNDDMVHLAAWGYGATGYCATGRGRMAIAAAENWTDAAQGTYISFDVTETGGIVTSEKVRIWSNGGVQIGGTFTASPGTTGLAVNGIMTQVSASGFTTIAAATQDGVKIVGRTAGTASRTVSITPTTLTASRTFTLPDVDGTATTGTGTAAQIAYWSGTNAVTGAATLTLTTTSGAALLAHAAGTSTATTTTAAAAHSATFSGVFTTGPTSALSSTVTFSGATNTAAVILTSLYASMTASGAIANATSVSGSYVTLTATPSGNVGAIPYTALHAVSAVTSAANTRFASGTLLGALLGATLNTANTTGVAVAAAVVGAKVVPSVVTTNASGTNTLAAVYGLWVAPGTFSSTGGGGMTVTNYYGLYLATLTLTTMTVTNRYGVYQQDPLAVNYFASDVKVATAGKGFFVAEGTNAKMGQAVLTAGTVTVATTAVNASSRIFLSNQVNGGTAGFLRVSAQVNGTSFDITSSSNTDTSTISWLIVDAA